MTIPDLISATSALTMQQAIVISAVVVGAGIALSKDPWLAFSAIVLAWIFLR